MEKTNLLFNVPEIKQDNTNKCLNCINRERWQCNSKVFQYCKVRKSNRTSNGLLKIKCKDVACHLFKSI